MKAYEVEKELAILLENEATRIMDILLDMYRKKIRVNERFDLIVGNLIKKEFKLYDTVIISKVTSMIPLDLMLCPTNEWVFVTEKEYNFMMELENAPTSKDELEEGRILINDIAKKIIANYKNNNLNKKNILEIIYDYIPKQELINIDSKAITYMIKSIVCSIDENYQVTSINPLAINGL